MSELLLKWSHARVNAESTLRRVVAPMVADYQKLNLLVLKLLKWGFVSFSFAMLLVMYDE